MSARTPSNDLARSAVFWLRKGGELYHAMQTLLGHYEEQRRKRISGSALTPLDEANHNLLNQIHMLFGMACECWLKAALLAPETGFGLPFETVVGKGHKLRELAQECQLVLSERELEVLGFAEDSIAFFGRYPVDRHGRRMSHVSAGQPRGIFESIVVKISDLLPSNLRQQMIPRIYRREP